MQCCQEEERQEVIQITLADTGAHPGAVMVLSLDADTADAAVEGTRWAHDHAGRAQSQIVRLLVRVDDPCMLEAIICEKVGVFVAIVGPLRLCLVLNVDTLGRCLIPDRVAVLTRDGGADAWLSVRARINQSQQIKNARHIDQIYDYATNSAKQL